MLTSLQDSQFLSCTSFNFLWTSSYPTHLDKTPPGISRYSSPFTRALSFSTFSLAVSSSFIKASFMGIRQSPLHYSSWNFSFNISIMDSFLLLTSTLVLSPSNIICEPSVASTFATDFRSSRHVLFQRLKTSLPSSGSLLCMGLGWVPLGRSSPLVWQTTKF